MTVAEAIKTVRDGIRPGLRGAGCATILMADGNPLGFHPANIWGLERMADAEIDAEYGGESREVSDVTWTCDDSGAIYASVYFGRNA